MSRVGKKPITVPNNVQLSFADGILTVKGPKGTQVVPIADGISFNNENGTLTFQRVNDDKKVRALHGLSRALTFNAIEGVSNGFQRNLAIEGVGFKAEMRGQKLLLTLGFSHPILVIPPAGVELATPTVTVKLRPRFAASVHLSHTKEKVFVMKVSISVARPVSLQVNNS
ncbi:MAG: hypothetical protein RL734_353 [Bacteroidota bacterium]